MFDTTVCGKETFLVVGIAFGLVKKYILYHMWSLSYEN